MLSNPRSAAQSGRSKSLAPLRSAEKCSVVLLGASLSTGNMGVTALGEALVSLLHSSHGDVEITVLAPGSSSDKVVVTDLPGCPRVQVVSYRYSPLRTAHVSITRALVLALIARFLPMPSFIMRGILSWKLLNVVSRASIVADIFGGDSFSDIYGLRRFLKNAVPRLLVTVLRGTIVMLPQTYGPFRHGATAVVAKLLLSRSFPVMARDEESARLVEGILRRKSNATVWRCPDVAFALPASEPRELRDELKHVFLSRPVVGMNISGLLYNGGYTRNNMFGLALPYARFVRILSEEIIRNWGCTLLLVPHTNVADGSVEDDHGAAVAVRNSFDGFVSSRISVLRPGFGPATIKYVLGDCAFFVGARMHSCIGALSQGVPTVGVAYSRKFAGVFSSIGAEDLVLDARTKRLPGALDFVRNAYSSRDKWRRVLRTSAAKAELVVQEHISRMMQLSGFGCEATELIERHR